ncbi:hypothetical protein M8C21_002074, partial [Ambrosia artemisiifolia]
VYIMTYRTRASRTNDVGSVDDLEKIVCNYDHPWIQFYEGSVFHKKLQTLKGRKLVKTKLYFGSFYETWMKSCGYEARSRQLGKTQWML